MIRKFSLCGQCSTIRLGGTTHYMVAPADRIVHLYHRGCRWNSFLYTTAWQQKLFDASLSLFPEREDKDRSSGLSSFTIQKEKTRSFLDESTYPLGSFSDAHFSDIKITLETISRQNIRDSDSLELALDLLERLLRELRVRFRAKHARWICHPRFFNGILHNYQVAAKIGVRTGPPEIVWKRLLTMAQILPEFQLDNVTVAILFDAMLHFRPPLEKPHFAEHFLNDLWDKWRRNPQPALPRPDRNVYALVLLAWSNSKLPVAGEKIENLIGDMRTENVAFDEITYNIFMRYFAERGEQGKVESILEEMIKDGVKPTRTTLSHMIYCYCYVGDAFKAEKVLRQLVGLHPKNDRESNIVGETVQMILSVHRKNLENCSDEMEKTRIMRSAENLFQSLEKIAASNEQDRSKLMGSMMDLYAQGGSHEKVEEVFRRINHKTVVTYNILIKSYGRQDKPDKAMALLQSMMERTSHIRPDLVTFNSVLNAWADSSRIDAVENAVEVFRLMDENPNRSLRPDVYSFSALLKCMVNNPCENTTRRVQDLFDDMYYRHRTGQENVKPNVVCFTLAIKACLKSEALDDALKFLDQMETSDIQPNVHTYNEILQYWSSRNNIMAAERAELFFTRMRQRSVSRSGPSLKGDNTFLTLDSHAYTLVMIAWLNSGTPESSERAWQVYEWMKADNVIPKIFTFVTLIPYYACSNQPDLILKADELLGDMEVIDSDDVRPDNRFYSLVIKGWIAIGDSKRALAVANRLIDAYIQGGCQGIEPDPECFDLVVDALLQSKDINLATRFVDTIQDVKKKGCLSSGVSTSTLAQLVDSWRMSTHPEKDVHIATLEGYIESM